MNVGFVLPSVYAVGNPFNGIREQALYQAEALAAEGLSVQLLNPWKKYNLEAFDIVQFFQGGPALHTIEVKLENLPCTSVFAPIIDSMTPHWQYRIAKVIGSLHPKLDSIPSHFAKQAIGANGVIARSEYERSKLIRGLGVDSSKIKIVLNGCVKPKAVSADLAREKYNLADDFILHISRYSNPSKNVLNMIKAIGPTGRKLVIAGTADQASRYHSQLMSEVERFSNVEVVGRVEDEIRDSLYAACHVFCLPSFHEGTGLVAVEAASYGANVVITDQGGPPDYFLNYADYVSNTEVSTIANAVELAWTRERNDGLKNHVINNLTWEKSARSLMAAFTEFQNFN